MIQMGHDNTNTRQRMSGIQNPNTVIIPIGHTVPSLFLLQQFYQLNKPDEIRIIFVHIVQPRTTNFSLDMCMPVGSSIVTTNIPMDKQQLADKRRLCLIYVHHARIHGFKAKSVIYVDSHPESALVQATKQFGGDLLLLWAPEHLSHCDRMGRDLYKYMIKHSSIPITILPTTWHNFQAF
ncbi:hypothetical protein FBUS_06920 [Fasciolopsis buskii]|uniref:Uncharacterized protein n=1 Tax=Fasciolopsis buskii TaxID=27845 RepID=A0A8E0S217_9TREM|nr:hypothetical protein FBUS_06920 [Fasciolopsis buski]